MDQKSQKGISGSNIPVIEVPPTLCASVYTVLLKNYFLRFLLHPVASPKTQAFFIGAILNFE